MRNVAWVLIVLSALSFALAVVGSLTGLRMLAIGPEGYSRACVNLALISIALLLVSRTKAGA
jgi:hypothetical protein